MKKIAAPLAALMVLSACNVTVDEGRPYHPPMRPDRPQQACTMEYAPVCGVRNGKSRTFGNSCSARAEGYRITGNGACGAAQSRPPHWQQRPGNTGGAMRPGRPNRPERPSGNWNNGQNRPQTACTREYAPVCASNRGRNQTFSNACMARNAGFETMRNGACR